MSHIWRVGVIGLGSAGQMLLKESSAWSDVATVTCGMDINQQVRERSAARFGIDVEASVEALCERDDIDIVYVASPTPLHASHASCAAEHGKHVMVEKPLAWNLDECDNLIETARVHRVQLMAVHTPSFNAPVIAMRKLVQTGQLGSVLQVTSINYVPWLLRPRFPEELDFKLGGGVVGRQAPHQVDMVWYLVGGRPAWVRAQVGRVEQISVGDGHYSATVGFTGGEVASLIFNGYGYFDSTEMTNDIGHDGHRQAPAAGARLRAFGGAEKVAGSTPRPRQIATGFTDPAEFQPAVGWLLVSCEGGDLMQSPTGLLLYDASGRREIPCGWSRGPFEEALKELVAAAEGDSPLTHDGAWGKTVLQVCRAIHESAERGVEVALA